MKLGINTYEAATFTIACYFMSILRKTIIKREQECKCSKL